MARVDYRDVAEVAARAFVDERLAYGTFELCAGMPDSVEIAAIMSEVLGRRIVPREVSFEDWAANLPLGPDQKQLLANVFRRYAASGSGGNSLVLEAILGRKPTPLRRYIEELAEQSPSTGATRPDPSPRPFTSATRIAMASNDLSRPHPMNKLPARYGAVLTPLIISVLMSCIVSGIATANGLGVGPGFLGAWMSAWLSSWVVAFPTLLVVLPLVRRIVAALVQSPDG